MLVAHISDLHLGRTWPGDQVDAERLNSLRQALHTLAACNPDVLIVAGDTFDGVNIDPAIVDEAAKSLGNVKNDGGQAIPVVIIPGNHDPADADKLWSAFQKSLGPSSTVRLALTPTVIELVEGKLLVEAYPCPTRFSAAAPWDSRLPMPARADGVLRVVVAHGTLQGGPVPEGEGDAYPFSQAAVEALGADYVALGHFHGVYPPWTADDECQRTVCYCGTHEPDQHGGDTGFAILATLSSGQPTRLRRLRVARRTWHALAVGGPADLAKVEDVRRQIETGHEPARFVIRLKVDGKTSWPADALEQFTRLEASLRALGAQVERRGEMRARADLQALDLTALPSGAVKETLLALQTEWAQTAEPSRREVLAAAVQLGWDALQDATPS